MENDPRPPPTMRSTAAAVPVGTSLESQGRALAAVILAASVAAILRGIAAVTAAAPNRSRANDPGRDR